MKPAPFSYHRPDRLADAIDLLAEVDGVAFPLMGGQSLIPMLNLRLAHPDHLVDLKHVPEMTAVSETDDMLCFGAGIRHAAFEDGAVPDPADGLLRHVGGGIAYRAVRNRGTIGGSLCLADSSGDWAPVAVALGAVMDIAGPGGRRTVAAREFFLGPYSTVLQQSEVLTAIRFPRRPKGLAWGHYKFVRKAGEYATSIAVIVRDGETGSVMIVIGGIGAPVIMEHAAKSLQERPGDKAAIDEAAAADLADWIDQGADDVTDMPIHIAAVRRAAAGVQ